MSPVHLWRRVILPRVTLPPLLTLILAAMLLFASLLRGADYIALPQDSLSVVEQYVPIAWLGWTILCAVLCATIGWLSHRWSLALAGHGILVIVYMAFGVTQIAAGFGHIAGDEWRNGADYVLAVAAVHALIWAAVFRQWRPRARR